MRSSSAARRLPTKEIALVVALVGVAFGISYLSGRSLVLAELAKPFLGGVQTATNAVGAGTEKVASLRNLEAENTALKAKILELETALRARDEQSAENGRLHDLLKLPVPAQAKPITVARVIGRNPDNWHQRLLLDKGGDAGLVENAVIANRQGLIGKIVTLGSNAAIVSLLTDPQSSVSVLNSRTRSAGVIQGQGDSWPVLRYMEQPEKWKVGDRLITSGLGGVYPKGLLVGRIVKLKTASNALIPDLRVEPIVSLDKLEEVVVMPPGIAAMPTPQPTATPAPKADDKQGGPSAPKPSPSAPARQGHG
jgi:rod shape-determining protein MreC